MLGVRVPVQLSMRLVPRVAGGLSRSRVVGPAALPCFRALVVPLIWAGACAACLRTWVNLLGSGAALLGTRVGVDVSWRVGCDAHGGGTVLP